MVIFQNVTLGYIFICQFLTENSLLISQNGTLNQPGQRMGSVTGSVTASVLWDTPLLLIFQNRIY